jgi:hypothetical protein
VPKMLDLRMYVHACECPGYHIQAQNIEVKRNFFPVPPKERAVFAKLITDCMCRSKQPRLVDQSPIARITLALHENQACVPSFRSKISLV